MPASNLRSSSLAILFAAGLLAPGAFLAAERPVAAAVVTPQPAVTWQGTSVSASSVNVAAPVQFSLIVGAEASNGNRGAATIWQYANSKFKKIKTLSEGDATCTDFGKSVSMPLSGTVALVGAPGYGASSPGSYSAPGSAFFLSIQG